jgi:hypothetical protein
MSWPQITNLSRQPSPWEEYNRDPLGQLDILIQDLMRTRVPPEDPLDHWEFQVETERLQWRWKLIRENINPKG